ncbi:MAG: alpha-rhamnosidase [Clostridia bacterium]|nr:alpha-rhamnosidase [Clostridia bacterium]
METLAKAQWIWYPGDYEIFLGGKTAFRRTRRNIIFPPSWRIDKPYMCANFYKDITLEQDSEIFIKGTGQIQVTIPQSVYPLPPCKKDTYLLPKGTYTIYVSVYSPDKLPAIFVDGAIKSDKDWFVSENMVFSYCKTAYTVPVGTADLTDPNVLPGEKVFEYKELFPVCEETIGNKKLYDFGKETFGYVCVKGIKGNGTIRICYGESAEEALDSEFCEVYDLITVDTQTEIQLEDSQAMRYLAIECEGCTYSEVSFLYEYLPIESKSGFSCSDNTINEIYDVALYTLHLTCREVFLDGIKRDRWAWMGDAYQSILMNFYSFYDKPLNQRTLTFLLGKEPFDKHINHIIDYTFYWYIALYDHYMHFGDLDYICSLYPRAKKQMQFVLDTLNKERFVEHNDETWIFLDWGEFSIGGALCAEQILFHKALTVLAFFAELFGDSAAAQRYKKEAVALKRRIFKTFWDEERGIFLHHSVDGLVSDEATRYANIFALLYGYVKGEKKRRIIEALKSDEMPPIVTPYFKMYELAALGMVGEYEYIVDKVRDYWGGMLERGATSFWELYDPDSEDQFSMYGRKFGKSYCHAWGASPLYLFGRFLFGVTPTKAGYEEYEIRPHLASLKELHGCVPIIDGSIEIDIINERLRIKANTDKKGTLFWKGKKWDIPCRQEFIL